MYIPGETRENDKARRFLIENCGLLALIAVNEYAIEEELKLTP